MIIYWKNFINGLTINNINFKIRS